MAGYVSGSGMRLLVIGFIAIGIMSVGAATVTESVTIQEGTPTADLSGGGASPGGQDQDTNVSTPGGNEEGVVDMNISQCIDLLDSLPGTIAYFGIAGLVFYGINRRFSVGTTMMAIFGTSPILVTAYFLNTQCTEVGGTGGGIIGNGTGAGSGLPMPEISPVVLLGIVGIVLVAAAAVVVRATGDQYDDLEEDEDEEDEGPDVTDLAEAAGAAADRLEKHNADVDNAVYRAWWEMTQLLDVPNPDSATPGEFAEAAIEVGMGRDHVEELTTLFEEVRYGKRDASSREEHAIEVFRTIESEYGAETDASFDDTVGSSEGDER